MPRALLFLALCLGCAPATSAPEPPQPRPVYDVSWLALVRDYETASAYTGQTVRVRLAADEYTHEAGELRVWAGLRSVPPALVFKLAGPLPPCAGPIVVVGVCKGPQRDFIWRSPRADFFVTLEGATASAP